jgi:hypothetical protein
MHKNAAGTSEDEGRAAGKNKWMSSVRPRQDPWRRPEAQIENDA